MLWWWTLFKAWSLFWPQRFGLTKSNQHKLENNNNNKTKLLNKQ